MKRSKLFLIVALTVPAVISLAGVSAAMRQIKTSYDDIPSRRTPGWVLSEIEGDLVVVHEGMHEVGRELHIETNAAEISITFDPALTDHARVKVEAKTPGQGDFELHRDRLKFSRSEDGDPVRITLALPTDLDQLKADFKASLCRVRATNSLKLKELKLDLNASSCNFDFAELTVDQLKLVTNAGKTEFDIKKLGGQDFVWGVNAGSLEVELDELAWLKESPGEASMRFEVATGQGELMIGKTTSHSIRAVSQMGKIGIKREGQVIQLAGLNEERNMYAGPNAPLIRIDVQMGQVDVKIDEIVTEP